MYLNGNSLLCVALRCFPSPPPLPNPQRARAARQDVTAAEREVAAAKALCDRWRVEEDAAVAENRRLQVHTVDVSLFKVA